MKHKSTIILPALIVSISACFPARILFSILLLAGGQFTTDVYARMNNNSSTGKTTPPSPGLLAVCGNPTAMTDLDINNVRCRILTAGDLWWDYSTQIGKYEIPKGSNLFSVYAGALWLGGYDQGGQLRVAGQTYGHAQGNNDFWPGPLDTTNATITDVVCNEYDKFFSITRKEVEDFVNGLAPASQAIKDWPGNGDMSLGQAQYLAPFIDVDGDGMYNSNNGDYPGFDLTNTGCITTNCVPNDQLYGDQSLWWVFNDKGDVHAESGGLPIGLEIRTQAFGYATNDEINNMTFYNFRIYNRSTYQLDTCYFGVWCDADLGNYQDDYVGCDVSRGLGYTYNGDNDDEVGAQGYGANPPAVGIDFFQGPITNPTGVAGDGVDNDRDCQVDEPCEQAIMSKFVYYTNAGGFPMQDPANAVEYYNYLSGRWQNGARWTYGGDGNGGGTGATTTPTDFCFPGTSDHQYEWGTGGNCQTPGAAQADWTEVTNGGLPADRRMMQSAGPFTLLPGAVNVITTGVVWARASSGGAQGSLNLLKFADTKAQALFDNCFQITNGPDAPDLTIQEMDKQLFVYLTNGIGSNNYQDNYSEKDPYITSGPDTVWKFQGYKLYQLKDATVSSSELEDVDRARLVGIYDNKDGVTQIINYYIGVDPNPNYWTPKEMVNSADNGVQHSVVVTKDLFATGDPTLINHKTYYFMALAYGYNPGEIVADPSNPSVGYNLPYIAGRRNVKAYSAIPHIHTPESGGTEIHGAYGSGPMITRIEGNGNGGMTLDFTDATTSSILSSADHRTLTPSYALNGGPINVRVVDPLNVPDNHNFTLKFDSANIANSTWTLVNNTTGEIIYSDRTIAAVDEKLILQWGLSVAIVQVPEPSPTADNYGFLEATMSSNSWLTGLADVDVASYSNWIRSGNETSLGGFGDDYTTVNDLDQVYEGVLGGTWAPYRLSACSDALAGFNPTKYYTGPGFKSNFMSQVLISDIASVNVVLTADKSKWSRCVVFEMCEDSSYGAPPVGSSAKARKLDYRRAMSVDKNGNTGDGVVSMTDPNDADYISETGMGWFPGYAVNLETGERLNVCFGENSALVNENGNDMKWNPTSNKTAKNYNLPWDTVGHPYGITPVFGGQHYIYVFGHNKDDDTLNSPVPNDRVNVPRYDAGKRMREILGLNNGFPPDQPQGKVELFKDAMWVNIPLLASGHSILESDVTVRLRVGKSYKYGYSPAWIQDGLVKTYTDTASTAFGQNRNLPMYTFTTEGIATHTGETELAKEALDLINVVPNPYYAFSSYETGQLDNRIKITNLPESCTVSIYNLSGTLIRRYKKAEPFTMHTPKADGDPDNWHDGSLDWDLKNTAGIPISGGVYIIHVEVPGIGEKILKWFGIMRPIDIDSF